MAKTTTSNTKGAPKAPAASAKAPTAKTVAAAVKAAPARPASSKGVAAKTAAAAPSKIATPATVTLRHLSAALAERHDLPKKQADTILTDVFASLVDRLKAGERVRIAGLGIIEVKNRAARMGRNPATGEAIQIKASKKVAFRPAKELKEAI